MSAPSETRSAAGHPVSARPKFTYTLVIYRANGVDTCRNCVMGRSDSDFELAVFSGAEDLARYQAKHRHEAPHGREYAAIEYTVLLNGRDEWNDPPYEDEGVCDPVSGDSWYCLERQRIAELVRVESAALAEAARQARERAQAEAEARALQAQQAAAQAREARDRAEYARLQAKFGAAR